MKVEIRKITWLCDGCGVSWITPEKDDYKNPPGWIAVRLAFFAEKSYEDKEQTYHYCEKCKEGQATPDKNAPGLLKSLLNHFYKEDKK